MPLSKSDMHRALIGTAVSGGFISNMGSTQEMCVDCQRTLDCLEALGAEFSFRNGGLSAKLRKGVHESRCLYCGESGSTLRLLLPLAGALGVSCEFSGAGKLPSRPMEAFIDCLRMHGLKITVDSECGWLPLHINGRLEPGDYVLPGNISSQFISGLLMSLPLLDGDSRIILSTPLESSGYVDMTIDSLRRFGIAVDKEEYGWKVPGKQCWISSEYSVDGDWSAASFFLSAASLGSRLHLHNLKPGLQPDFAGIELFRQFGCLPAWEHDGLSLIRGVCQEQRAIDVSSVPDLFPPLAVSAASCPGRTVFTGIRRLRMKESDRVNAMSDGICALGASVEVGEDSLAVNGVMKLHGGKCSGFGDHRVVMALAVAATGASGPVTITDAEAISKSFPEFFKLCGRLGMKYTITV